MLSNSSRKFFLHNTDRTRVEPKKTATFFCLLFIPTFIMAEKKLSIRELRAIKKDANQKNLKKEKRAKANYFDSSVGKKNPQANQKKHTFCEFSNIYTFPRYNCVSLCVSQFCAGPSCIHNFFIYQLYFLYQNLFFLMVSVQFFKKKGKRTFQ